jgi:hypothetical protein
MSDEDKIRDLRSVVAKYRKAIMRSMRLLEYDNVEDRDSIDWLERGDRVFNVLFDALIVPPEEESDADHS